MMRDDDEDSTVPDLSNRKLLEVLMGEIVAIRKELKEDIGNLDKKITDVTGALSEQVKTLSADVRGLRLVVHQNQTAFITRLEDHDKAIAALQVA